MAEGFLEAKYDGSALNDNTQTKAIRVLSFDMDGCILNRVYLESEDRNLITHNKDLLDEINVENKRFNRVITFSGSNRQSFETDKQNADTQDRGCSKPRGSSFPALKIISDYLDATMDTMLLADIFGKLPLGKSYELALSEIASKSSYKHAGWMFDESKVLILYAQMHKVAVENPDRKITFDFYDDREDILNGLRDFFSANLEMIPANVTLKLHNYHRDLDQRGQEYPKLKYKPIQGQGFNDYRYQASVIRLAELAERFLIQKGSNYQETGALKVASYLAETSSIAKFTNELKVRAQLRAELRGKLAELLSPAEVDIYLKAADRNFDLFDKVADLTLGKVDELTNDLKTDPAKEKLAVTHGHEFKKEILSAIHNYCSHAHDANAKTVFKTHLQRAENTYVQAVLGSDRTELSKMGRYFKKGVANLCSHLLMAVGVGFYMHIKHYQKTGNWLFYSGTRSEQALSELKQDLIHEVERQAAPSA